MIPLLGVGAAVAICALIPPLDYVLVPAIGWNSCATVGLHTFRGTMVRGVHAVFILCLRHWKRPNRGVCGRWYNCDFQLRFVVMICTVPIISAMVEAIMISFNLHLVSG